MPDREALLRGLYAAFNARDIDAVLAGLSDDVDWPNAWEGGRLRGREAVRDYWTRQWAAVDPTVAPLGFDEREDGSVAVDVDQAVRGLDGALVGQARVRHVYRFRGGRIARMDVEDV